MMPGRGSQRLTGRMLTTRDQQLLETLALRVRVITAEQAGRLWWGSSKEPTRHASRRLRRLVEAGLVDCRTFLAHPILPLEKPVFAWEPGAEGPDAEVVSYALKSRWTELSTNTQVYCPTQRTKGAMGGGVVQVSPLGHETHDLHLTEVYLRFALTDREAAERWLGEESFAHRRRGEKRPDAMLLGSDGEPELVVEFAGKYSADHVRSFHLDCQERGLRYELW